MKTSLLIATLSVLPLALFAQGYKTKPAPAPDRLPAQQAPGYVYMKPPNGDGRLSKMAMSNLSKKPTDRQVDSVYNDVYKTEVPVFYENTQTPFRP